MTAVQLRVPGWTDRDALAAAVGLRELCDEYGALFLVNDRADIALASAADGVHLGVDDLPVSAARRILGPDAVIGFSPETNTDIESAAAGGANYLGVGPVYGTATKSDAGPAIGTDRIAELAAVASVPVIGIGGITPDTARPVIRAGACGVAVVSSVFMAEDPGEAAIALATTLE